MVKIDFLAGVSPAYESPSVDLVQLHSQTVLCVSGTNEDFVDGGDVDWFNN